MGGAWATPLCGLSFRCFCSIGLSEGPPFRHSPFPPFPLPSATKCFPPAAMLKAAQISPPHTAVCFQCVWHRVLPHPEGLRGLGRQALRRGPPCAMLPCRCAGACGGGSAAAHVHELIASFKRLVLT
eukprot:361697-Chlamydomonas_euryale.AAC.2